MNIKIKSIEYYHPKTVYTNEYFLDHFNKQGIDISGLLNAAGRNTRYISEDPEENTLTMAVNVAKKAVKEAHINKDEIGLVVSVASTPEYLSPTNAMRIHTELNLGMRCSAYDMNGNCTGLILALDQVSRVMKTNNRIKYALLVGSDQLFRNADPTDALTYADFAESACALVLENTEDDTSDYIDNSTFAFNKFNRYVTFPAKGLSYILNKDEALTMKERKIKYDTCDFTEAFDTCVDSVYELLDRNHLSKDDIKLYCVSQFGINNVEAIRKALNEKKEKFPFIGDKFGYTGLTSPFLAFKHAIDNNQIKRGEYAILWTVGAGVVASACLIRY